TSHKLGDLLGGLLDRLQGPEWGNCRQVTEGWSEVVGPKVAPLTEVESFENGFLRVRVKNGTLLSLLAQYEKSRLLKELRRRFPKITIKTIQFFIG
ncbi:MAG: DUF721 domain-containing protein, partial [Chlamydiia bacterium]|nr:DUF721 domain-containing protein [Chlamydiia bacterium]